MKQRSKIPKSGYDSRAEVYYFDIGKCKHCLFKDDCYKEGIKSKTCSVKIKDDAYI